MLAALHTISRLGSPSMWKLFKTFKHNLFSDKFFSELLDCLGSDLLDFDLSFPKDYDFFYDFMTQPSTDVMDVVMMVL